MLGVANSLDWGEVIAAVVPSIMTAITAVIGLLVHRQIKTPSGDPIGHVVERAHDTGIANNMLLRTMAPATRDANGAELHEKGQEPLQIPADEPGPA